MGGRESVLIIGGSGHIGGFLAPRLVKSGYKVTVLTRGNKAIPAGREDTPRHIKADYGALTREQKWAGLLGGLRPGIVIDILSRNAPAVVDACPACVEHYIVTGSVWMYGKPRKAPTPEQMDAEPFEGYRERYEQLVGLLGRKTGPAITAVMPSNIAGPGKIPLEPYGGRSIEVHRKMALGEEMVLPLDGMMLVSPCDAEDVAEVFALTVEKREKSAKRLFNAGPAHAVTYNELVAVYGRCYGVNIPIRHVTWDEFKAVVGDDPGTLFHHEAHMCPDISAARETLGYKPKHTPEAAMSRAVDWMKEQELI